jgi:hypothetical protein
MTPTLCHCGRHKDRCRCAGRREAFAEAAAECDRQAAEWWGLASGSDGWTEMDACADCATAIRDLANGAP